MKISLLPLLFLSVILNGFAETEELPRWEFDTAHSNINFSITHLGLNRVTGSFGSFTGNLHFDPENPEKGKVMVEVLISSINTNNANRDDHLNSDDFFDSGQFPLAVFQSTDWKHLEENRYEVTGDLTIMDQTKEVTLEVELIGTAEVREKTKSGWTAAVTLDRYDWGVGGRSPFPIGREVRMEFSVQADLQ